MSTQVFPKIITDGLVFFADPMNSKSFSPDIFGGDDVYFIEEDGQEYVVHVFSSTGSSTFTPTVPLNIEYLIVAGGGGGGRGNNSGNGGGGGGGAGGALVNTQGTKISIAAQEWTIVVGAGGAEGVSGSNSSAFGLTAVGGGAGGTANQGNGATGGSGGGGSGNNGGGAVGLGGAATAGQGNPGSDGAAPRNGGGGGGFSSAGVLQDNTIGGYGGDGFYSSITGERKAYAGGGGGGGALGKGGFGGIGGGGRGGVDGGQTAREGSPNTGGGGGGGSDLGDTVSSGRPGGSGIVVIRYLKNEISSLTAQEVINSDSRDLVAGVTGTLTGTFSYSFPESNLIFDGTTNYIAYDFYQENVGDFQNFTWSFWNNYASLTNDINSHGCIGGGTYRLYTQIDTTGTQLQIGVGDSFYYPYTFPDINDFVDTWFNVTVTYDGGDSGRAKTYINGVLVDNRTGITTTGNNPYPYCIGRGFSADARFLNGKSSSHAIYARTLSDTEVLYNFNAVKERFGL